MNVSIGACEPECPNNAIYEGGAEWTFSEGTSIKGFYSGHNSKLKRDADQRMNLEIWTFIT